VKVRLKLKVPSGLLYWKAKKRYSRYSPRLDTVCAFDDADGIAEGLGVARLVVAAARDLAGRDLAGRPAPFGPPLKLKMGKLGMGPAAAM